MRDKMLEEALNITQRQKRAMIAKRNKQKLTRSRQIAARKLAPDSIIKKRAYALARKILRKRIAGGRGAQYQELGPTEKEAIDKQLDSRKALIKKIALRLIPRIKQSEQHRLQSFLKGKAMKNIDEAKEELNDKFKKTFKKKKETGFIKILNKFAEEAEYDSKAYRSLVKKAEKHNVDIDYVAEIYNSAFNDYDNVDTSLTEQQYAFSRVNQALNEIKYLHRNEKDHVTHEKPLDSIGDFSVGSWTKSKATSLAKKHNGRVIQTLIKGRHKVALNERNKENKFKKDLYVVKKGIERAKLNHYNVNSLADRSKHDYHINYSSDNDDASHRHSSRKTNIRLLKNIGRSTIRNEENLQELSRDTLNSYKKKAKSSLENSEKKYDSFDSKAKEHQSNSDTWYKKAMKAKYHDLKSAPKRSTYPWDTHVGAMRMSNSEGLKSDKFARKADVHAKIISKRDKGLTLANKKLKEENLQELSKDTYDNYIDAASRNRRKEFMGKQNRVTMQKRKVGIERADRLKSKINEASPYHSAGVSLEKLALNTDASQDINNLKYHARLLKSTNHDDHKISAESLKNSDTYIRDSVANAVHKKSSKKDSEIYHNHAGLTRLKEEKLDELSMRTLSSYNEKSRAQLSSLAKASAERLASKKVDLKTARETSKISRKRYEGLNRLRRKITEDTIDESSSRAAIMDKIKAANSNLLKIKDGTHKKEAERQKEIRKNEKAYNNSSREVEKYHSDKVKEHKKLYLHHKKEWQNHEDMKHDLYSGNLGYDKNDHKGIRGAEEEISYQQGHHEKKMMHHHEMMHKHNSYLNKPHKLDESQVAQHGKLVKSYKTAKGHPFDLFHKGDTHTLIRRDNSQVSDIYTGKTTRELHKSLLKRFLPEETLNELSSNTLKSYREKSFKSLIDAEEKKSDTLSRTRTLRAKGLRGKADAEKQKLHGIKKTIDKRFNGIQKSDARLKIMEAKQFRYIISGVHQDQGHVKTQAYYADSHEHAKQQFIDDHGEAYHYFKVKKLTYPKLRGESVETQAQKIKKINDKFRRQIKNNQNKLEKNKQAALKEVLGPENQIGTPALTKKLKKATPGQENAQIDESQYYSIKHYSIGKRGNTIGKAKTSVIKAKDIKHARSIVNTHAHFNDHHIERIDRLNPSPEKFLSAPHKAINESDEIHESNAPYIHYSVVMHHPEKKLHKVIKFSEKSKDYWHDDRVGWKLPHPAGIGATIDNHPEIKKHKAEGWHQVELGGVASHSKKAVLENARKVLLRQKTMSKYKDYKLAEELDLDEACWDGYKQIGMKKKGKKIVPNCVKEDVKSAETRGVVVPAYVDDNGNTIPAKVVKRKTGKKILSTENPFDGK